MKEVSETLRSGDKELLDAEIESRRKLMRILVGSPYKAAAYDQLHVLSHFADTFKRIEFSVMRARDINMSIEDIIKWTVAAYDKQTSADPSIPKNETGAEDATPARH